MIEPTAFDAGPDGTFVVADAPNGRERLQFFAADGQRLSGFILPGRATPRVTLGSLSLSGISTLQYTGRSVLISQPETGALLTEYGLAGTPVRTIGRLRRTGHEADRELHLALNAGFPLADPTGGFWFVFLAGTPAFSRFDASGTLLFHRVMQGREIDPVVAAIPDVWPRRAVDGTEMPLVAPAVRAAAVDGTGRLWVSFVVPYTYVYDTSARRPAPCSSTQPASSRPAACTSRPLAGCSSPRVASNSPFQRGNFPVTVGLGMIESLAGRRSLSRSLRRSVGRTCTVVAIAAPGACRDDPPTAPTPPTSRPSPCSARQRARAVDDRSPGDDPGAPAHRRRRRAAVHHVVRTTTTTFPVGSTRVACAASDSRGNAASCSYDVVVAPPPLPRTSFLAFGDSMTAGEITVPVSGALDAQGFPLFTRIVVPSRRTRPTCSGCCVRATSPRPRSWS